MENISEFNKNLAILYEKDAGESRTEAIRNLLDCDDIGLEIVKRFVLDRSNRVSIRLLAIVELWHSQKIDQAWIISIIEDANEYLFLQQDFLEFLCKHHEEQWLERLTHSQNPQVKREAATILGEQLSKKITELNLAIEPYRDSLQLESRKLEALSRSLAAEEARTETLHQQLAEIHDKLRDLENSKHKLNAEISQQKNIVEHAQMTLDEFKYNQQQKLDEIQQRIHDLTSIAQQTTDQHLTTAT